MLVLPVSAVVNAVAPSLEADEGAVVALKVAVKTPIYNNKQFSLLLQNSNKWP